MRLWHVLGDGIQERVSRGSVVSGVWMQEYRWPIEKQKQAQKLSHLPPLTFTHTDLASLKLV